MRLSIAGAFVTATVAFTASAAPPCTPAWSTVDDFLLPTTTLAAAAAITTSRNSVYVAGMSSDTATGHWVVRKFRNGVWSTVDDYIYSIGLRSHPQAIVRTGRDVFVAGGGNNASNAGPWLVRRSTNRGATWSLIDTFEDPAAPASFANAAVVDRNGAILVGGPSNVGAVGYHWVVRSSANLGASWTTSDDVAPMTAAAGVTGLALATNGDVYACGYNWDGAQYRWQVRRRPANSAAWSMVDDFVPSGLTTPNGLFAYGVAAGAGTVMVAGAYLVGGAYHWVVRRSTNSGASWTVADDFGSVCIPHAIGYDSTRDAWYAVGRCATGSAYSWITRRSADGGATWTTEDTYQLTPGESSRAMAVGVTGRGEVYVAGRGGLGATTHWIVRHRTCN